MRFLFIILFLFPLLSNAADFKWKRNGSIYTLLLPSAQAVCDRYKPEFASCSYSACSNDNGVSTTIVILTPTQYRCQVYSEPSHTANGSFLAERSGDTCPSGTVYNSTTGGCGAPACAPNHTWDATIGFCKPDDPCKALTGTSDSFSIQGNHKTDPTPFYNPYPGGWSRPSTITVNGCEMAVSVGASCKAKGNGDFVCTGNASYTGITAGTGENDPGPDSDECTGDECPDTDPAPTNESAESCTPWVYGQYGLERQCTSTNDNQRPGSGSCLTDGSLVCVKPSPTPSSDVTATTSDQTKNTDQTTGNTTTVTNNTTNKTVCLAGSCTTTTTTNKTTVVNNAAGDQVSKENECKGPQCPSTTNPDADGDGLGDCIKNCSEEEEEDEEEGSASVSESCDAAPECDGDPFQCAILKQVHYNSCEERRPFNDEEKQQVDDAIQESQDLADDSQEELDTSLGGFFSEFKQSANGNGSPGSGQCLQDKEISFLSNTIVLPFSQVCPFIEIFRMALLAVAYLIVARTIHTQI